MTGIIADTWKAVSVPRDPNSSFHWEEQRGSQQERQCLAHATMTFGLLEDFCVLGRTGRQPPAHSKFLEDTASVNGDQALTPLLLASLITGSAHMVMQRCGGLNVT